MKFGCFRVLHVLKTFTEYLTLSQAAFLKKVNLNQYKILYKLAYLYIPSISYVNGTKYPFGIDSEKIFMPIFCTCSKISIEVKTYYILQALQIYYILQAHKRKIIIKWLQISL